MAKKPRSSFNPVDESMVLNQKTYDFYFNYLYGLVINSIIWENVPSTINVRFLEVTLAEKGYALFFKDEILGYLGLTCTIGSELDVYRIPIYRKAYATNGYRKSCSLFDSVLIFNNYQHTPDLWVVDMYARKLTIAERTTDVNLGQQKFPYVLQASPQQYLSLKNFFMKMDGFCNVIDVGKNFDMDSIKSIPLNVPFIADKVQTVKHSIMNDFLTWLGAENSNQDKKERLVTSEIGANYGNVELSRNIRLSSRLDACRKINEMFGLDISCRFNSDLNTMLNLGEDGGVDIECLYDTSKMDSGDESVGGE